MAAEQEPLLKIGSVVQLDGHPGHVMSIHRWGVMVWFDHRGTSFEVDRKDIELVVCGK